MAGNRHAQPRKKMQQKALAPASNTGKLWHDWWNNSWYFDNMVSLGRVVANSGYIIVIWIIHEIFFNKDAEGKVLHAPYLILNFQHELDKVENSKAKQPKALTEKKNDKNGAISLFDLALFRVVGFALDRVGDLLGVTLFIVFHLINFSLRVVATFFCILADGFNACFSDNEASKKQAPSFLPVTNTDQRQAGAPIMYFDEEEKPAQKSQNRTTLRVFDPKTRIRKEDDIVTHQREEVGPGYRNTKN